MLELKLTNTITGKKELFLVRDQKTRIVKMYVCGITPYALSHIGHGRCYVMFDFLKRLLQFLGYQVIYCRNFTDIDDKIITKAVQTYQTETAYFRIAEEFISAFEQDMNVLGCQSPTYEPKVTDHLYDIITSITKLIEKGYAYVTHDGSVYYRVKKFKRYGMLSHRSCDDMLLGARIAIEKDKEDPLDFALWKSEPENHFWKSPWGWGRPGWHIECSVLSSLYLGAEIDIHGGGMDLIFPHHENEIAQSEALSDMQFVRYWLHNAFVRIDSVKMSKSLGNTFTLRDVFHQADPMVLRYYYLMHHYRSPLDFSFNELQRTEKVYERISKMFSDVVLGPSLSIDVKTMESEANEIWEKLLSFLCDDLNIPGAIGVIFEYESVIKQYISLRRNIAFLLQSVFGISLTLKNMKKVDMSTEIQNLIEKRDVARREKNWKLADELREKLSEKGYQVQDKKLND